MISRLRRSPLLDKKRRSVERVVLPDPPPRQLGENELVLILSDVLQYRLAFVSVIWCLAAALGRWPAGQLMTQMRLNPQSPLE